MAACLVSGLVCTIALSLLAYAVGRELRSTQRTPNSLSFTFSLCLAVGLPLTYAGGFRGIELLPLPDVLLWSSLSAPFLCFTAGLATCSSGLRSYSRSLAAISLVSMALGYTLVPLLRPAFLPVSLSEETQWDDGICLQSDLHLCTSCRRHFITWCGDRCRRKGSCQSMLDERPRYGILGFVPWSQDLFEFSFSQNLRCVIEYGCLVVRRTAS